MEPSCWLLKKPLHSLPAAVLEGSQDLVTTDISKVTKVINTCNSKISTSKVTY